MTVRISFAPPQLPDNHKFGWFFAAVFSLLAIYAYLRAWENLAIVSLNVAIFFVAVTLVAPQILSPLNRLWYELGMLLGKIVSPILLGIIFFLLITPISLITKMFGRDELKMKKIPVKSYWVDRLHPCPTADSFKNQF
jgi:hypothetical protein